jgi:hypothetical protein
MHLRSPFHFFSHIDDLLSLLLLLTLLCLHLLLQLLDPEFFDVLRALILVRLCLPRALVFLGLVCRSRLSISHL